MNLLVCEKQLSTQRCQKLIEKYDCDTDLIEDADYSIYYRHDFKSAELTKEISQFLPGFLGNKIASPPGPTHASIRWYFTKYEKGGFIKPHTDGHINIGSHNSTHTLLLYLNDDYEGGELEINGVGRFHFETGTILLMSGDLLHHVDVITKGNKYILRSDLAIPK
jgi:Rps23 Pro-64 3,4-dihydroxylase Tpa1-like proline 4-hydroxylase